MQYIVLDLEWDNDYYPKIRRSINQILQIGAVKLDENFNLIDTFSINIKSVFSKKVSSRFSELTGITKEIMLNGVSPDDGVNMYNAWAGNGYITITYSDSDLRAIHENEENIFSPGVIFNIENYLDAQKYFQNELALIGKGEKNQISLKQMGELFEVESDNLSLHTARDDCILCAEILKKCYNKERFERFVHRADDKDFYNRLFFKKCYIRNINDPRVDLNSISYTCPFCKEKLVQVKKWSLEGNGFRALYRCRKCRTSFTARRSFKITYDGVEKKGRLSKHVKKEKVKNGNM